MLRERLRPPLTVKGTGTATLDTRPALSPTSAKVTFGDKVAQVENVPLTIKGTGTATLDARPALSPDSVKITLGNKAAEGMGGVQLGEWPLASTDLGTTHRI